jgi:FkbM family methyltransferase
MNGLIKLVYFAQNYLFTTNTLAGYMSRFSILSSHLPFFTAWGIYRQLKGQQHVKAKLPGYAHPLQFRNNPHDFATFCEVSLEEAYQNELATADFIIDGGGNIGLTAAYFANQYPGASIATVEPDSGNFAVLQRNTAAYPNIHPLQGGVWSRTAHLRIVDKGVGHNAFTVTEVAAPTPDSLQAYSIADIMALHQQTQVDIVKLDIEGAEKQVLAEGYESWLPRTRLLIVELHDRMVPGCSKALFSAICQYDFRLELRGENLFFYNNKF